MEIKRQRISKEENCMLPDIKTYYKAVLTKTVGIGTRIDKETNGQCSMIHDKADIALQQKKKGSFQ